MVKNGSPMDLIHHKKWNEQSYHKELCVSNM